MELLLLFKPLPQPWRWGVLVSLWLSFLIRSVMDSLGLVQDVLFVFRGWELAEQGVWGARHNGGILNDSESKQTEGTSQMLHLR